MPSAHGRGGCGLPRARCQASWAAWRERRPRTALEKEPEAAQLGPREGAPAGPSGCRVRLNQARPCPPGPSPLDGDRRLEVKRLEMFLRSTPKEIKENFDVGPKSPFTLRFLPKRTPEARWLSPLPGPWPGETRASVQAERRDVLPRAPHAPRPPAGASRAPRPPLSAGAEPQQLPASHTPAPALQEVHGCKPCPSGRVSLGARHCLGIS
uniref:Uncharacterized protein n=1 Tax=Pipistrellus kuhlii TaxID=59472 RepID=A0A7J7YWK0_PIPKU|nr:hypothetical protein mPipKuh1_009822 [Pipistrellus kuhlii]